MQNAEIEHIIRACTGITGESSVVIIGSQAILASFSSTQLPDDVTFSLEADIMFFDDKDGRKADLVDGAIGEFSVFHDTFGIYAQGVGEETGILPSGWKTRLVELANTNTGGGKGLCLDPYDLCAAKLCAFRDKDLKYVSSLLDAGLIVREQLLARISEIPRHDEAKEQASKFLLRA